MESLLPVSCRQGACVEDSAPVSTEGDVEDHPSACLERALAELEIKPFSTDPFYVPGKCSLLKRTTSKAWAHPCEMVGASARIICCGGSMFKQFQTK